MPKPNCCDSQTFQTPEKCNNCQMKVKKSLFDNLDDFLNIFNTKIDEFIKLDQIKNI